MQDSAPSVLNGKAIRPAIIELGLPNAALCNQTQQFYQVLLGTSTNPLRLPADMALICVVTGDGTTRTLIYWDIAGKTLAALTQTYDDLINADGCTGVHKPHKPTNPLALLQKGDMYVCTLLDTSGNEFGLVTNPPYPPLI